VQRRVSDVHETRLICIKTIYLCHATNPSSRQSIAA